MRGDKGCGARLAGGRSGGRGRDRGAGGWGEPGAGARGRREPVVLAPALYFGGYDRWVWVKAWRGEGKAGLGRFGGNGSENEMKRIKGRKG